MAHDYGCDIICEYKGTRFCIQCKDWTSPVGSHIVGEVVAACSHYQAEFGVIITNNVFTAQAIELANANDILLIDYMKFYSFIICSDGQTIIPFDEHIQKFGKQKDAPEEQAVIQEMLDFDDLIIRYGCSKQQIMQNHMNQGLPYHKAPGGFYFYLDEVENWEKERKVVYIKNQRIFLPGNEDLQIAEQTGGVNVNLLTALYKWLLENVPENLKSDIGAQYVYEDGVLKKVYASNDFLSPFYKEGFSWDDVKITLDKSNYLIRSHSTATKPRTITKRFGNKMIRCLLIDMIKYKGFIDSIN